MTHGSRQQESAVKRQSAFASVEDAQKILPDGSIGTGVFVEVFQDAAKAHPDDAGCDGDQRGIDEMFGVHSLSHGEIPRRHHAGQERDHQHQAVAVDGDDVSEQMKAEEHLPHGRSKVAE